MNSWTPHSLHFSAYTQQALAADTSTAHSSSPELVETPRGEAELYEGGDMDELSKQLEKER